MVPKLVFFTKGVGKHSDELSSFELALRDAGIEKCNLVTVSSILPPGCKILTREEGQKYLKPGQITYCVMSKNNTKEPNRLIGAAIGMAMPVDPSQYGYISEYHSFGETSKRIESYSERLAATMLATTLGIDFDANKEWDELKQEYKMSGKIIKTKSIAQTAEGDKTGLWTTVISVAVFIEDECNEQGNNNKLEPVKAKVPEMPINRLNRNEHIQTSITTE